MVTFTIMKVWFPIQENLVNRGVRILAPLFVSVGQRKYFINIVRLSFSCITFFYKILVFLFSILGNTSVLKIIENLEFKEKFKKENFTQCLEIVIMDILFYFLPFLSAHITFNYVIYKNILPLKFASFSP